jgi:hypothetical protein
MVDVMKMPENSFGTVPTPAIVAPIEFSMKLDDYRRLGGHMDYVQSIDRILHTGSWHQDGAPTARVLQERGDKNHWPFSDPPMLG